jgi:hypothetical protein
MITFIRTQDMIPGKGVECRAWASEIANLVARITGNTVRVGMPIGGTPTTVCWIIQCDSLAQLEDQMNKWVSNAEFQAAAKHTEGLTVPGTVRDQIFQTN